MVLNSGSDLPVSVFRANWALRCSSVDLLRRHAYVYLSRCSFAYPAERENVLIQVLDLSHISSELAYAAEDADLVVMEGMVNNLLFLIFLFVHRGPKHETQCFWNCMFKAASWSWLCRNFNLGTHCKWDSFVEQDLISRTALQGRGIETNLYAQFKCDSLNIGMVRGHSF